METFSPEEAHGFIDLAERQKPLVHMILPQGWSAVLQIRDLERQTILALVRDKGQHALGGAFLGVPYLSVNLLLISGCVRTPVM